MQTAERSRRLMLLHRYNAYTLTFLAFSGVMLYLPGLRGPLASVREPLKNLHIAAGLLSAGLLLAYVPLLAGHWLRLLRRYGQQVNVLFLVALLVAWLGSGVVIWLHRWLPEGWAASALVVHDWSTWIAVPWAGLHALTRWLRWRFPLPGWWIGYSRERVFDPAEFTPPAAVRTYTPKWRLGVTRRQALQALGVVAGVGAVYTFFRSVTGWSLGGGLGEDPGYKPPTAAGAGGAAAPATPATPAAPGTGRFGKTGPVNPDDLPDYAPTDAGVAPVAPGPDMPKPSSLIPVGGGRQGRFRLYTVAAAPKFDPAVWSLSVNGLVSRPRTYSWHELITLPRTVQVNDFHCVTGWRVHNITWEGVRLAELLQRAGVKPEGKYVKFYSGDGVYTDALPLGFAMQAENLVPYLIDSSPIPIPMGGPVRLVVPKMYGYKSVKWLSGIEVTDGPHSGFWEERGYPSDALLPEFGGVKQD